MAEQNIAINYEGFYKNAGHKISEMLLACKWRGQPCSASDFKQVRKTFLFFLFIYFILFIYFLNFSDCLQGLNLFKVLAAFNDLCIAHHPNTFSKKKIL